MNIVALLDMWGKWQRTRLPGQYSCPLGGFDTARETGLRFSPNDEETCLLVDQAVGVIGRKYPDYKFALVEHYSKGKTARTIAADVRGMQRKAEYLEQHQGVKAPEHRPVSYSHWQATINRATDAVEGFLLGVRISLESK